MSEPSSPAAGTRLPFMQRFHCCIGRPLKCFWRFFTSSNDMRSGVGLGLVLIAWTPILIHSAQAARNAAASETIGSFDEFAAFGTLITLLCGMLGSMSILLFEWKGLHNWKHTEEASLTSIEARTFYLPDIPHLLARICFATAITILCWLPFVIRMVRIFFREHLPTLEQLLSFGGLIILLLGTLGGIAILLIEWRGIFNWMYVENHSLEKVEHRAVYLPNLKSILIAIALTLTFPLLIWEAGAQTAELLLAGEAIPTFSVYTEGRNWQIANDDVSAVTYNFVGITNPAGATSNKAWYGTAADKPTIASPGTEFTQTYYDNAESSNDVRATYFNMTGDYVYQLFRFYVDVSGTITQISGTTEGWGYDDNLGTGLYSLWIYNHSSSSWEQLGSTRTLESEGTITGSKTSNLTNYIDANKYIYLLARGGTAGYPTEAEIYTDYVKLDVTYASSPSTYTFSGISNPSSTHKATYGHAATMPAPTAVTAEATTANYTSITTEGDSNSWTFSSFEVDDAYMVFRFAVAETGITGYTGYAKGYGYYDGPQGVGNDYYLYIWDSTSSAWSELNHHTAGTATAISGSKTTDLSRYKDANNYVYLAVKSQTGDSDGGIVTDYVKLSVAYAVGSSPSSPTISGKAYSDEGSTALAAGKMVSVSLNGGAKAGSGMTRAGGFYQVTLTGATMTGGTIVSVFLDNQTEDAVTVTLGSGSSMTGMHLYQDHLIVRSDSGSVALTNAHLAIADNSGDSDLASIYRVSNGALQIEANKELYVWTGDTFAPGGRVSTHDLEVKGTLSMGTSGLTASGSFVANAGTFTTSTGIVLNARGTSEALNLGNNSLQDLTIEDRTERGLVGWWKFDEGANTSAADSSGNGNTGTLTNSPTWSSTVAPTKFSNPYSLSFDGTNDYVVIANEGNFDFTGGQSTIGFWSKTTSSSSQFPISKFACGSSGGWTIDINNQATNKLGAVIRDANGGGASWRTTATDVNDGLWHYIGVIFNFNSSNPETTIYIDNRIDQNAETQSGNAPAYSNQQAIVGARCSTPANFYNGLLDDIRVYNRALSAQEIARLASGYMVGTDSSAVYTLGSSLDMNGSVKLINGKLVLGSNTVTVAGNWENRSGTGFVMGTSSVTFDGAGAQTISGTTVFNNVTIATTSARTVFFDYLGKQSVSGSLVLHGVNGNLLSIRSTKSGSGANIILDGNSTQLASDIAYLNVKDSNATGGQALLCYTATEGCVNGGNDMNWTFTFTTTTATHDFTGVTNPAGATVNKATSGYSDVSTSVLPTPPSGTEALTANYSQIASEDGTDWNYNDAYGLNAWQMFRFYVTESDITQLTAYAKGRGSVYNGYQGITHYSYYLKIYNFNSASWETLASHTNNSDTAISADITSNLPYYRDGSNYVYVVAQMVGDSIDYDEDARIYTDYAKLDVTYSSGGTGAPTISGKAYSDEGSTALAAGKMVSVSLNGGAKAGSGLTRAGGFYQVALTGATMTGGTIVSVFLDDQTEDAVTVTLGSGSSMTGMHLYQDHLIVRSDSGSVALTNAHLAIADNSGDSDLASIYRVSNGTLQIEANKELYVWTGDTFAPGGRVFTHDLEVKGTLSMGTSGLTASGSFVANAGTFTTSTGILLNARGTSETLNLGTNSTQDLTLEPVTTERGLVGWWKFDEGTSTSTADSSGNGNTGTLTNSPTWSSTVAPTKFSNPYSLSFDGTNDYVDVSDGTSLNVAHYTIALWLKVASEPMNYAHVISKFNNAASWTGFAVGFDATAPRSLYLASYNTSGTEINTWDSRLSIPIGSWRHVAYTFNGSTITTFSAGVVRATTAFSGTYQDSTNAIMRLGALASGSSNYFPGSLDDVRLYNRALSAQEIMRLASGYMVGTDSSANYTLGSGLDVNGSVRLVNGKLTAGSNTVTVAGNWENRSGTGFVMGTSSVTFDGAGAQTISGTTVFNNLTIATTAARSVFFDYLGKQSVSGSLVLHGVNGNLLSIRSTKSGSGANIILDGDSTQLASDIAYLNVKDSNATGGQALLCYTATEGCVNGGNDTNWTFTTTTIGGKVYSNENGTVLAGITVAASANGNAAAVTDDTDGGGEFSIAGLTFTGGTIVTLYLDGETQKAVTIVMGTGATMTGIHLYQNHLILKHMTGGMLTNQHIAIADNNGDTDIKAIYSFASSTGVIMPTAKTLLIATGTTLQPGGTMTAGHINAYGNITMGTNLLKTYGHFRANGIVTSSGTLFLAGTGTSVFSFKAPRSFFTNIRVGTGTTFVTP